MQGYRKIIFLAALILLAPAAGRGQGTARLTVIARPETPAARVEIDRSFVGNTPLTLADYPAGKHVLRVSANDIALQAEIDLRAGRDVVIEADFTGYKMSASNKNKLGYDPIQGPAKIMSVTRAPAPGKTPPPAAPPAPAEGQTAAPNAPAAKPSPSSFYGPPIPPAKKPEPGPVSAAAPPPPPPASPPPPPASPPPPPASPPAPPAPEKDPAPVKKPEPAPAAEPGPAPVPPRTETAPASPPPAVRKPVHPCPATKTTACENFENTVEGTVRKYYCLLSRHDFDRAYRYRTSSQGLGWFYDFADDFCRVNTVDIRDFVIESQTGTEARVSYTVDLISPAGEILESWRMKATLVKRGEYWLIHTTSGKKIGP